MIHEFNEYREVEINEIYRQINLAKNNLAEMMARKGINENYLFELEDHIERLEIRKKRLEELEFSDYVKEYSYTKWKEER